MSLLCMCVQISSQSKLDSMTEYSKRKKFDDDDDDGEERF